VGEEQPPILHALAHAINAQLQAAGATVTYTEPVRARVVDDLASLRELCNDIDAGSVELLVILGGNPVYTAPADLQFVEKIKKVPLRVCQSLYYDETAFECHWHLPESHYLEQWGDIRAYDGTISIV